MLNGQIADAAARVQHEGAWEGVGRAGAQATRTTATGCALQRAVVFIEFQTGQEFAEKEVTATTRVDEHGVLAEEAEAGLLRVTAL